jgi:hypothetical protein
LGTLRDRLDRINELMQGERMMATFGEKRVQASFNVGREPLADEIKQATANLIDLVLDIPAPDGATEEEIGEVRRLISLAMTSFEQGAMWAVKAATAVAEPAGQ